MPESITDEGLRYRSQAEGIGVQGGQGRRRECHGIRWLRAKEHLTICHGITICSFYKFIDPPERW
jgi:hypothetical protein